MIDPFTISAGLALAGGAMDFISGLQASEEASRAADYNAGLSRRNAQLARDQARQEEARLRVMGDKEIGQTRANLGASGLSVTGSALDILAESARNLETDALAIRHIGETQAQQYEFEAREIERQDRAQRQGAVLRGISSLLGTGARTYDLYSRIGGGSSPAASAPRGTSAVNWSPSTASRLSRTV